MSYSRNNSPRLVFAGGIDWSAEFLKLLLQKKYNLIGVIIPLDSQKDRGQKIRISTLKKLALTNKLPVWQPKELSDSQFLADFRKTKPDLVVVVAYGKLFPPAILKIPTYGFLNFHPSLLPKLRGPSPIQSALLQGLKETGVGIMKLEEGMDDGPILEQQKMKIAPRENNQTLTRKLIDLGKKMLPKNIDISVGAYCHTPAFVGHTPIPQNHSEATFCHIIKKEETRIDWSQDTATIIDRKIRAFTGWLKVFTFLKKNRVKRRVSLIESIGILSEKKPRDLDLKAGYYRLIVEKDKKYLAIGTRKNILLISQLQVEGKKIISASDFWQGYTGSHFI